MLVELAPGFVEFVFVGDVGAVAISREEGPKQLSGHQIDKAIERGVLIRAKYHEIRNPYRSVEFVEVDQGPTWRPVIRLGKGG